MGGKQSVTCTQFSPSRDYSPAALTAATNPTADLPITLDVEDIREVVTLPVAHLDSPHLLP